VLTSPRGPNNGQKCPSAAACGPAICDNSCAAT